MVTNKALDESNSRTANIFKNSRTNNIKCYKKKKTTIQEEMEWLWEVKKNRDHKADNLH